jgi:hypothetical protein
VGMQSREQALWTPTHDSSYQPALPMLVETSCREGTEGGRAVEPGAATNASLRWTGGARKEDGGRRRRPDAVGRCLWAR